MSNNNFSNTVAMTAEPLYRPKLGDLTALAPLVVRAGQGPTYRFPCDGITGVSVLKSADTGGAFSVLEVTLESGAALPLHVLRSEDVLFYSRNGDFHVQRGDETFALTTGMALRVPRGIRQSVRNTGDCAGHLLFIVSPGGFERYCEEVNAALNLLADPSDASHAHLEAIMDGHGMELLAPASESPKMGRPLVTGPLVELGDHRSHALVSAEETNGTLLFAHAEADSGGGVPPHIHRREDEVFYILQGIFTFTLGDKSVKVGPGDCVFAPRDVPHSWLNTGGATGYLVVLFSPGDNFEPFAYQMAQIVQQAKGAKITPETNPALFGQMLSVTARHGIEFLPPS